MKQNSFRWKQVINYTQVVMPVILMLNKIQSQLCKNNRILGYCRDEPDEDDIKDSESFKS